MTTLGSRVFKIRSKNAGPFWITVDIFCGSPAAYTEVSEGLATGLAARQLGQPADSLKRFELPALNVIKLSFPRPVVQGSRFDRDMHGAQWAVLLAGLPWQGRETS